MYSAREETQTWTIEQKVGSKPIAERLRHA